MTINHNNYPTAQVSYNAFVDLKNVYSIKDKAATSRKIHQSGWLHYCCKWNVYESLTSDAAIAVGRRTAPTRLVNSQYNNDHVHDLRGRILPAVSDAIRC